jgi:hypothetical protein
MAGNARIRITAEDRTKAAIRTAQNNFKGLSKSIEGVTAAIGVSTAGIAAYAALQVKLIAESKKFADQLGITTQSLNELAYAFGVEGNINAEQFADTLQELNVRLGEAAITGKGPLVDAFKELGLSIQEVRRLDTDKMLLKIASAFGKLEDQQRSQFLAEEIFAGEAAKMTTLLTDRTGKLNALTEEYRKLKGELSEEDAEKIAEMAKSWARLTVALEGLAQALIIVSETRVSEWIDEVARALGKVSGWVRSNKDVFDFLIGMTPIGGFATYREGAEALKNELLGIPDTLQEVENSILTLEGIIEKGNLSDSKLFEAAEQLNKLYKQRSGMVQPETVITVSKGRDEKPLPEMDLPIMGESYMQSIIDQDMAALDDFLSHSDMVRYAWEQSWKGAQETFTQGMGDAFADAIIDQSSLGDAMQATMRMVAKEVISSLVKIAAQRAVDFALGKTMRATETAAGVAQANTLTAAYAPAAAAASIATGGGAAISGATLAAGAIGMITGAILGQAHDGLDYVPKTGTYLLEKGERVVKKEDNRAGMMGNTYNFNIQAIDTQSAVDFLMNNEGAIAGMMQARYESSGRTGGPIR